MDFRLSKEQMDLQKAFSAFCAVELAPAAADVDERQSFPEANWKKLAEKGFFGLMVPERYGGKGADLVTGLVALEEVSAACASTAMAAGTSAWCAGKALELYGTDAVKGKYLAALAKGDAVGAFATTEAGAGSDVSAVATTAKKSGAGYVVSGGKSYVTNASRADFIIVLAAMEGGSAKPELSLLLVPKDAPGLSVEAPFRTMGLRGAPASRIKISEVEVPAENLLGKEGEGLLAAMDIIDYTRLSVSATALGIARAAFLLAKSHAENRVAFGKPIGLYQDVAFRIADMYLESDVIRQLMYHAAWQKQQGMKCADMVAAAKVSAAEVAISNAGRAMTILAGKGCLQGEAAERLYRDAKLTEIAGGTAEILRQIIARELLKA